MVMKVNAQQTAPEVFGQLHVGFRSARRELPRAASRRECIKWWDGADAPRHVVVGWLVQ